MSWSNGRLLGSPMLGNKWNIENEFSFCSLVGENIQRLLVRKWKWTWDMKIFSQSGNLFYNSLGSSFAFPICLDGFLGVSDLGFWFRICSDVVVSDSGVAIVVQRLFWWDIEMRHGKCKHDWISPKKIEPRKLCTRKNDKKTHGCTLDGGFRRLLYWDSDFLRRSHKIDQKYDFQLGLGHQIPKHMVVFLHFFHQIKTSQAILWLSFSGTKLKQGDFSSTSRLGWQLPHAGPRQGFAGSLLSFMVQFFFGNPKKNPALPIWMMLKKNSSNSIPSP